MIHLFMILILLVINYVLLLSLLCVLVSKGIIDLHGGVIGMHSNENGPGSLFFIEIPILRSSMNQVDVHEDVKGQDSQLVTQRSNMHSIMTGLTASSASVKPCSDEETLRAFEQKMDDNRGVTNTSVLDTTAQSRQLLMDVAVTDRSTRTLIVDDAASNRKMLSRLLSRYDYVIDEASDGLEALSRIRESLRDALPLYDVIIMDFVMPNMDGPTATREIRALGYSGIIIGVTGNALAEDVDLFLSSGANKVLPKPVQMEDLMDILGGIDEN